METTAQNLDPLFDLNVPLEALGLGSASPVGGEAAPLGRSMKDATAFAATSTANELLIQCFEMLGLKHGFHVPSEAPDGTRYLLTFKPIRTEEEWQEANKPREGMSQTDGEYFSKLRNEGL